MTTRAKIATIMITGLILTVATLILEPAPEQAGPNKYIDRLETMAGKGETKAMHLLALEYEKGKVLPQDFQKAQEWLQRGAELGFGNAQIDLARYYYHGLAGEKNLDKAKEWYGKAEQLVDITTLHNLGLAYLNGRDVEQDYAKARELFILITQSSDFSNEQYKTETRQTTKLLGYLYLRGLGTDPSRKEAIKWLKIAADKGDESANEELLNLQKMPDRKAE